MSSKGTILAVDDTPGSLKLLMDILSHEGYDVRAAISGELALRAADKSPPDLVLLDVRMPGLDGYEVCRHLKAQPNTRDVPVIFVTAASETDEMVRGLEIGAVDYVTKPFHRAEMLARVRTHLELGRLRDHLEEQVVERTADLKASEAKLRESEALFHNYFNLAHIGMAIIAVDKRWLNVNNRLCEMLGYSSAELTNMTWEEVTHPDDVQVDLDQYSRLLVGEIDRYSLDKRFCRKDGTIIYTHLTASCQRQPHRSVEYIIASLEDISESKKMEELIRQMAFYDPLTQLPNRRLLDDRLEQAMADSRRNGCYGAVMFLDLDNFKTLNDQHGHPAGDCMLVEVAQRLNHCVREVDTVARFGGDEFVVLLSNLNTDQAKSAQEAMIIAEKIRTALAVPHLLKLKHHGKSETIIEYCCPATIGVTLFIGHESDKENVLNSADAAMFRAKESGRNCIRLYEPALIQ